MALTLEQLTRLAQRVPKARLGEYLEPLNASLQEAEVNTSPQRAAMFLATVLHETGGLQFFTEIWGPTETQRRYEGRRDLGNVEPGDGMRYRGRGAIQLTGRANYARYGRLLGVDLEGNPALAAEPGCAFRVAAVYWKTHHCNARADAGDFEGVTRAVNGGLAGWNSRQIWLKRVKAVLA